MDFDRLYIQDLLDTATRGHLAEQFDITPDVGAGSDEPTVTTQSLGEEGDDPEADLSSDVPFSAGPDNDDSGDDEFSGNGFSDDDFSDDGFGSDDFSDDDVFGAA